MADMLLELFKEEARINLAILENGLIEGEQKGIAASDIEPLMRAAHSLKGAARVIGLSPFVETAHACEDILVAAQNGKLSLETADYDLLLVATEELKNMAGQAGPGFEEWFPLSKDRIDALLVILARRFHGESTKSNPLPAPAPTQTIEGSTTEVSSPSNDIALSPAQASTELVPPLERQIAPSVDALAQPGRGPLVLDWPDLQDPPEDALVEFMKSEAEVLVDRLSGLLSQPDRQSISLETLLETSREIRGGALLVRAGPIAELARILAQSVEQVARFSRRTDPVWNQLVQLVSLVGEASAAFGPGFASWVKAQGDRLTQWTKQWEALFREPRSETPDHKGHPLEKQHEAGVQKMEWTAPPSKNPPATQDPAEKPVTLSTEARTKNSAARAPSSPETAERTVRINARALERLMGLAGESLIEARWLQGFAQSLLRMKRQQTLLKDELDEILGGLSQSRASNDPWLGSLHHFAERLTALSGNLSERVGAFEEHARQSDDLNDRLYREAILSRMAPFRSGVQAFPKMVREMSKKLGKQARLEIRGPETEVDRDILDKLDGPLTQMLRNSLDHGLEPPEDRTRQGKDPAGTLILEAKHAAGFLVISLSDDGKGVNLERIREKIAEKGLASHEMIARMSDLELLEFLFLPGFSTAGEVTEISGRGVGLDVVHSAITAVGGSVRLTSVPGRGTTIRMQLPLTLSVIRAVLARIGGDPFAFPLHRIDRLMRVKAAQLHSLQDKQFLVVDGRNVGLVMARQILQLEGVTPLRDEISVILFYSQNQSYALMVDDFIGEQDLAVKPLDPRLGKVPYVQASAILDDGVPILILDVDDLKRGIDRLLDEEPLLRTDSLTSGPKSLRRKRVLVTDDSITVREVQKQLLSAEGYEVRTAVDGMDGFHAARAEPFDLIVTDIDMPRMNGFELVAKIRSDPKLKDTPVVVVSYKDRDEDRMRGLNAGANYYLTKSSFEDDSLLKVVHELIGDPIS